jgi:hypothetical protein
MSKSYLAKLKATSDAANLRLEEPKAKSHNGDSRVLCDKPLTEQITTLMATLSPAQRNRPWSMDEFVARLHGRYSVHPHSMHVGTALRKLGWIQKRDWTCMGAGRRVWLLDESEKNY